MFDCTGEPMMPIPNLPLAALAGLVLMTTGSFAEDLAAKPVEAARYSMTAVEGGVMRLDGATGRLSFCTRAGDNFACKAVSDDRSSFMDELEALAKQNADLKKQIADGGSNSRLPKEEDIDKAFNLMERFVKRFGTEQPVQPK
jgi:hypothetical protein